MQGRKLVFTTAVAAYYEIGCVNLSLYVHIASVVERCSSHFFP